MIGGSATFAPLIRRHLAASAARRGSNRPPKEKLVPAAAATTAVRAARRRRWAPTPPAAAAAAAGRLRYLSYKLGIDCPFAPYDGEDASEGEDPRLLDAVVRVRGDRRGAGVRTYVLLPPNLPLAAGDDDGDVLRAVREARLASLNATGSVLFGARVHVPDLSFVRACRPLVERALLDVGDIGQQPQAMAALRGLCAWVAGCMERNGEGSEDLVGLFARARGEEGRGDGEEARALLEAVAAIATGKPRPGHKVLGAGTYRDGRPVWEALAKEYATTNPNAEEAALYRSVGGELVGVEYLADTSEAYMREAGGAMVRFFFL